MAEQR